MLAAAAVGFLALYGGDVLSNARGKFDVVVGLYKLESSWPIAFEMCA